MKDVAEAGGVGECLIASGAVVETVAEFDGEHAGVGALLDKFGIHGLLEQQIGDTDVVRFDQHATEGVGAGAGFVDDGAWDAGEGAMHGHGA